MTINRGNFRFFHRMRVRWADVDLQKIVFNPHYLTYFDNAICDYWRALALPYEATMQQLGGDVYLKKSTLEYHASARYDDMLELGLRCVRVGTSSMVFEGAVFRGDTLLVSSELVYVFADPATQRSKAVPAALRAILERYEAGFSVVQMRVGDWADMGQAASVLRNAVFVDEQGIGADLVWDAADATAQHALVVNHLEQPVASGRLVQHAPGVGRIGRMAVCRVLRGSKLGRDVLTLLVTAAQARGDHSVVLHAQCSAEGFYSQNGFVPQGAPFEEAGIAHIEMVRIF